MKQNLNTLLMSLVTMGIVMFCGVFPAFSDSLSEDSSKKVQTSEKSQVPEKINTPKNQVYTVYHRSQAENYLLNTERQPVRARKESRARPPFEIPPGFLLIGAPLFFMLFLGVVIDFLNEMEELDHLDSA